MGGSPEFNPAGLHSKDVYNVFELLQPTWLALLIALASPLAVLLLTPFIRPFSFKRFFLTYVIPGAPLLAAWDEMVSGLRCYTPNELKAMARCSGSQNYEWHIGTYNKYGVFLVTYLVGYPRPEE
ncbi:MAG: hypothetical protein ACI808_000268 [Paraglaciecola sp.]|jgi:hypothetical protein